MFKVCFVCRYESAEIETASKKDKVGDKTYLQFFCRVCANDSHGKFNFHASLARIASHAPDVSAMCRQAETEHNLLLLYKISLPTVAVPLCRDVVVDKPSVLLLQRHTQWLLNQFVPAAVFGDGNCLFRAVSLALYGNEAAHVHLRLLAAIEALMCPSLYDSSSTEYYAPYRADDRLVLSGYGEFVQEVAMNGSYSDMLTVLVLSSVIQKPIQTRWPILLNTTETSPMTKHSGNGC